MGRSAQRVGDLNLFGGPILTGDSSVLINGQAAAVTGSIVGPHKPFRGPHLNSKAQGKSSVLVGGKPLVATGDEDDCGHSRVGGSPDVLVG
jgi:uncharacterized Zn-binding protein involved in type VI secretion